MDPGRRSRIEALFDRIVLADPEEREARLREAGVADPELAREVARLLAAHERSEGILEGDAAPLAAAVVERPRPPRPLGPYRILGEVGRGGMSVVYRAERSDGAFRRRVALKVLRGDQDPEELYRRLEAERQILATLDHPGIARLLDGGVTEDGRPYLVMELVDGRPITDHCDALRLGVAARLRLFCTVARAVQHAHARLVVHRDLKPSNILVTPGGEVRLLDFGIAKVLDPARIGLTGAYAPVTRTGVRLLTPEYASPEQIRGEPASTANDVWALGVLLYELLTGARPFRAEGRTPGELEREILEKDPPRPSTLVLRGDEEGAARRASRRRALHRILEGDLDRIVTMALRKEAGRRYGSAAELADDVESYLAGRPVRAHADGVPYRIGKFLRRHRLETAAVALVLLAVLGGAAAAVWQARVAGAERDRATLEARRSDAVSEYLLDLFRAADPWELPAEGLSPRQLLARGEARLEAVPDDPVLRARILLALGQVYQSLGDPAAARRLLDEAVALRRVALGPEDPATSEALRALADLLWREGHLREAEAAAAEALAIVRAGDRAPDPAAEAAALDLLGFISTGLGRLPAAEAYFLEELDVLRRRGLGADPAVGNGLINVAAVNRRRQRYDEAEGFLREALAHRRETLGPDHPLTAVVTARLGGLLSEHLGRYDEAERLFEQALEIQTRILGPNHPARSEALGGLAGLHERLGRHDRAEAFHRESLRSLRAGLGSEHPFLAGAMEGLAAHLAQKGRLLEADSLFRSSIALRTRALGPDHYTIAGSLRGWASVLIALDRITEAEAALRDALAIRERVFGPDAAITALSLADLSQVPAARGDFPAREALLLEAIEKLERAEVGDVATLPRVRELLAEMYDEWGRPDDAARARAAAGS